MINFEIFFWWCCLALLIPILWYVSFSCKLITLVGVSSNKLLSKIFEVADPTVSFLKKLLCFFVSTYFGGLGIVYFSHTHWSCLIVTFAPVISILNISFMELTCFLLSFFDNTPHVYAPNPNNDGYVPFDWFLMLPQNPQIDLHDSNLKEHLINFSGLIVVDKEQPEYSLLLKNYDWNIFSWRGCICFFMCGVALYYGFSFKGVTPPVG